MEGTCVLPLFVNLNHQVVGTWKYFTIICLNLNVLVKAAAMADHFEKIQKLPDPVVGCPNFRR